MWSLVWAISLTACQQSGGVSGDGNDAPTGASDDLGQATDTDEGATADGDGKEVGAEDADSVGNAGAQDTMAAASRLMGRGLRPRGAPAALLSARIISLPSGPSHSPPNAVFPPAGIR